MKPNKSFSIGDRILSFGFAIQGLITFFKTRNIYTATQKRFKTYFILILNKYEK